MTIAPSRLPAAAEPANTDTPRRRALWVTAAVFVSFLAFSAIRSPVPGINEPHYLGKAKHFWDPNWCAGDFFLESSNAHYVFYVTVGWLTRFLTLEQTAWMGRAAALLLLAVGWTRLVARVVPGRWAPLWSAWTYLLLVAISDWSKGWAIDRGGQPVSLRILDFSGEWMVGGVEAKVFAYGLLFWGLALASERRWYRAAVCGGLAVSFHPVVGIWGLTAAALAALVLWWAGTNRRRHGIKTQPRARSPRWHVGPVAFLLLLACSLPGLIPALQLMGGVPERVDFAADYIQVFYRLQHHLDPKQFPLTAYASFGTLIAAWLVVRRWSAQTPSEPAFAAFVAGTLVIALGGLVIGLAAPPRAEMWDYRLGMKLMKFYPFRPADVMVPVAFSIAVAGYTVRRFQGPSGASQSEARSPLAWAAFGAAMLVSLVLPKYDANPSRLSARQLADWKEACRWIAENTPEDALFFTPPNSWAFKWYAQRPEYVAFKDCPQDPAGIVEWNRRLTYLRRWGQRYWSGGYTPDELRALHEETGITHVVARRLGPFTIGPVYRNGSYRVYQIGSELD